MEKIFLILLILIGHGDLIHSQEIENKNSFFEIGIRSSRMLSSEFLNKPKFKDQLGDPLIDDIGFIPINEGLNYGLKARYGKKVKDNFSLFIEMGYFLRNENVTCFCHFCDKFYQVTTFKKIHSIDLGIGSRYDLLTWKGVQVAFEFSGIYSASINESNFHYFSYNLNPLIIFDSQKRISKLLRIGYEQSFGDYQKSELFAELAISVKLNKLL